MRPHLFPVACALALAACGAKTEQVASGPIASAVAPRPSGAMNKTQGPVIVMLGDSLTAGFQLPAGSALPAALQHVFDDRSIPVKFVNAGVSGDTTADGLSRYDWSVKGSGANLLVVALGANDFLNDLPPEMPRKNLSAILSRAKADNLPVALVGVALPGNNQDEREQAYAAIYPDLAKQFGVPYFPNMLGPIAGHPELLLQDGIHPTEKGVEAMADGLADFLEPLVKDLG